MTAPETRQFQAYGSNGSPRKPKWTPNIRTRLRRRAAPLASHIRDHVYSLLGLGCVSAAAFYHSVFSGLLVTGVLLLVFEWKVSE